MVSGPFFGKDTVQEELFNQIETLVGTSSALQVQNIIENLENTEFSLVAFVIAVTTLLYGSTSVFASIQDGINVIWGLRPKPKKIALKFILNRLLSMAMIATIGFLMLISLSVDTLLMIFGDKIELLLGANSSTIFNISQELTFISIVFVVFTVIYRLLPDAKVHLRDVLRGALLSTVLFVIGKFLIGIYIGHSSFGTAYGAAGSLVMLLIWVYYSSIILLLGAEYIEVYTRIKGRVIKPNHETVKVITQQIEVE